MQRVAFVSENTLGHRSYLSSYVRGLTADPTLGVEPVSIDAVPLPADLRRFGDWSIRGLRRWGWDLHPTRWRLAASWNVVRKLRAAQAEQPLSAIVVNTQSVGLELPRWREAPPYYVCLDATFAQLARSPWLAPGRLGRLAAPLTLAYLRQRERELFAQAQGFFPWSELVARSLRDEYGVPSSKIRLLPPSIAASSGSLPRKPTSDRKQILFLGGDFRRKGGALLLEAYRRHLSDDCDLHIVTESPVPEEPGVQVHHGLQALSPAWRERWATADVFVFPSALETFGIVLVEALAFGVPVVSTRVGAAEEILDQGAAGVLLDDVTPDGIAAAVRRVLAEPEATAERVARGRQIVADRYDHARNLQSLVDLLSQHSGRTLTCAS